MRHTGSRPRGRGGVCRSESDGRTGDNESLANSIIAPAGDLIKSTALDALFISKTRHIVVVDGSGGGEIRTGINQIGPECSGCAIPSLCLVCFVPCLVASARRITTRKLVLTG